jgi:hypothetical protein
MGSQRGVCDIKQTHCDKHWVVVQSWIRKRNKIRAADKTHSKGGGADKVENFYSEKNFSKWNRISGSSYFFDKRKREEKKNIKNIW